jgi:hypothetical protein
VANPGVAKRSGQNWFMRRRGEFDALRHRPTVAAARSLAVIHRNAIDVDGMTIAARNPGAFTALSPQPD